MRLTREVRFFLDHGTQRGQILNTWSGTSNTDWVASFRRMMVEVEGPIDPRTGFLCNIAELDTLLRDRVIPLGLRWEEAKLPTVPYISIGLVASFADAKNHVPSGVRLTKLRLFLSPFLFLDVVEGETDMVYLTQSFEFSAAHRLYCASLSDSENLELFGKCAHPNGHGHNYVLNVTVAGIPGAPGDPACTMISLAMLDNIVQNAVVTHFDHKHLNLDCAEFSDLNPTVENIARVIWDRLDRKLDPSRLDCVRVWETPKTCAEYRGA